MGQNKKNKQDRAPRYYGKNINPMGNASRMGFHALSLFKDMAYKNFDYTKNSVCFLNPEFLIAAITSVQTKIRENEIYCNALNYAYGKSIDVDVETLKHKHTRALEGWKFILSMLYAMYNSGDNSMLLSLMNRLPDYKNVLG